MSMNGFFRAFDQDVIDEMRHDHRQIDQRVWNEPADLIRTDVESAWHVLAAALDGAGFFAGEEVMDALSNGCFLLSADEVREQAGALAHWTAERLKDRVAGFDDSADIYHLELYRDEDDGDLEQQFERLIGFYREAAQKELGAVFYIA